MTAFVPVVLPESERERRAWGVFRDPLGAVASPRAGARPARLCADVRIAV